MNIGHVRLADTKTLLEINETSINADHLWVLRKELTARLDPDGVHVCWGAFPHSASRDPLARLTLDGNQEPTAAPEEIEFLNGGARNPHLRSVWMVSVVDAPPVEAVIHLDFAQLEQLPIYSWTTGLEHADGAA